VVGEEEANEGVVGRRGDKEPEVIVDDHVVQDEVLWRV